MTHLPNSLPGRLVAAALCLVASAGPAGAQGLTGNATVPTSGALPGAAIGTAAARTAPVPAPAAVQTGAAPRQKVGVAFGGGAAKGFAHIGVLRWFEENRIPVDVAAGTSMGGLIGGAYAVGLSPDEVQDFAENIDWDLVFLNDTPFKNKTWRRKEDARRFPAQVEFGLKRGLISPTGLNSGREVDAVIDGLTFPYDLITDFDQLPTPMRLVAADTRKAEVVVMGSGNLSDAMRATMSLPGIFPPVTIGNQLLVDGGTLNNVPADVVRGMGADFVISIDVGGGAEAAEAATQEAQNAPTLFSVMGAAIDTMMRSATNRALKETDLLIVPKILPYGSMSWKESRALAQRGYEAAEAHRGALLKYQVDEATYAAWQAARQARRRSAAFTPAFVDVVGGEASRRKLIDDAIVDLKGQPLDLTALKAAMDRLHGTDRYETIRYGLVERDGQTGLQIDLVQKGWGPPFLELGFELNNLSTTTFAADLAGRATFDGFLGGGSEFRFDFSVGTTQLLAAENFRPLWGTPFFLAPRGFWMETPRYFVLDGEIAAEYQLSRLGWGADLGVLFGNKGQIRVGYEQSDTEVKLDIGSPLLPTRDGMEALVRLDVQVDTQNSPMVPTHGVFLRGRVDRYLDVADVIPAVGEPFDDVEDFTRLELKGSWFKRVGMGRIVSGGGFGTTFDAKPGQPYNFTLGGPFTQGALVPGTLVGPNYIQATGGYLYEIGRLPSLIGGPVLAGGWLETGGVYDEFDDKTWNNNLSGGVIVESILGPIFGGVSIDLDGGWRYYISIGRLFR
jgi:NTE family protein